MGVMAKAVVGGTTLPIATTFYGTCTTAAATARKAVTCSSYDLDTPLTGMTIHVRFKYYNTAEDPYLVINGKNDTEETKIPIYRYGTTPPGDIYSHYSWNNNSVVSLTYDGTGWIIDNWVNTIPSPYVPTSAGTAAKVGICTGFSLLAKSYMMVGIGTANTSKTALTLNINETGAKPIYINGEASSSSNYTLPAGTYLVYYNGTNYYFRTDGKITGDITGDAETVDGHSLGMTVPTSTNSMSDFLCANGSWLKPPGTTYSFTGGSGVLTVTSSSEVSEQPITIIPAMTGSTTAAGGVAGYVPAPPMLNAIAEQYLCADGTWKAPPYPIQMIGATSTLDGSKGLVPVPPKDGYSTKYLCADGTWKLPAWPTNVVGATDASDGFHGLVPAATTSQRTYMLRGDATWSNDYYRNPLYAYNGSSANNLVYISTDMAKNTSSNQWFYGTVYGMAGTTGAACAGIICSFQIYYNKNGTMTLHYTEATNAIDSIKLWLDTSNKVVMIFKFKNAYTMSRIMIHKSNSTDNLATSYSTTAPEGYDASTATVATGTKVSLYSLGKAITWTECEDISFTSQSIAGSDGSTFTTTLPANRYVIGVELRRAWPKTNWNNGALVNIINWAYVASTKILSVALSTTSAQQYDFNIRYYYVDNKTGVDVG